MRCAANFCAEWRRTLGKRCKTSTSFYSSLSSYDPTRPDPSYFSWFKSKGVSVSVSFQLTGHPAWPCTLFFGRSGVSKCASGPLEIERTETASVHQHGCWSGKWLNCIGLVLEPNARAPNYLWPNVIKLSAFCQVHVVAWSLDNWKKSRTVWGGSSLQSWWDVWLVMHLRKFGGVRLNVTLAAHPRNRRTGGSRKGWEREFELREADSAKMFWH